MKCSVTKDTLISVKLEENKDVFHIPCTVGIHRVCFIKYFIKMVYKNVRVKKISTCILYHCDCFNSDHIISIHTIFSIYNKEKENFFCTAEHLLQGTNFDILTDFGL